MRPHMAASRLTSKTLRHEMHLGDTPASIASMLSESATKPGEAAK